tara:strand:+ start:1303 stop:1743 length:441 start_codon:yes stop_codon:yes gene_type:complete
MYSTKPPVTKKNKPAKKMKECPSGECQHEVPKSVAEAKKIKPKEVFGDNLKSTPKKSKGRNTSKAGARPKSKKVPKGSHRMPDGSIMKDSAMTDKSKKHKKQQAQVRKVLPKKVKVLSWAVPMAYEELKKMNNVPSSYGSGASSSF